MDKQQFTIDKETVTLTLNLPKIRTKAQRHAIMQLVKDGNFSAFTRYLESFRSRRSISIHVPRLKSAGIDRLSRKKPGSVYELFRRMFDTSEPHRPNNTETSWTGVEIECLIPYKSIPGLVRECGVCAGTGVNDDEAQDDDLCPACNGRGHPVVSQHRAHESLARLIESHKIKFANVKDDGSLRPKPGYFTVEITILTQLDKPSNLKRLCELLKDLGAKVDKHCGLHVHLDSRHLSEPEVRKVGLKFKHALPVLSAMVPKTRRENAFCKPSVSLLTGSQRYHAINLLAYRRYKTIEIRLHSGTTDFDKIINWTKLVSAIMQAPRLNRTCLELNELTEFIYLDCELVEYITQRTALFSPQSEDIALSAQDLDSIVSAEETSAA